MVYYLDKRDEREFLLDMTEDSVGHLMGQHHSQLVIVTAHLQKSSVGDPDSLNPDRDMDPDPAFSVNPDPNPNPGF
jgi:hypothetical protein